MFLVLLAWKDVIGLWRRYSGLAVLVVISVAAVAAGLMLTMGAESALKNNIEQGIAQRTINVMSDFESQETRLLDVPAVESMSALPGVESVEPTYSMGGALLLEDGRPVGLSVSPARPSFPPPLVGQTRPRTFPLSPGEVVLPSELDGVPLSDLLGQQVDFERSIAIRPGEARATVERMTVVALSDPAWQEDGPRTAYIDAGQAWRWYDEASPGSAEQTIAEQGYSKATVVVATAEQVDGVLRQVQATGLGATAVQQLTPRLPDQLNFIKSITRVVLVVLIILAATSSAFLVRGLVFQRTREVGLLKALGYSGRAIWSVMAMETVMVAWIGAVGGLLFAVFAANAGRTLIPASALPRDLENVLLPDPWLVVGTLVVAAVVILVGGAMPLLRAFRLDAARALRDWQ